MFNVNYMCIGHYCVYNSNEKKTPACIGLQYSFPCSGSKPNEWTLDKQTYLQLSCLTLLKILLSMQDNQGIMIPIDDVHPLCQLCSLIYSK